MPSCLDLGSVGKGPRENERKRGKRLEQVREMQHKHTHGGRGKRANSLRNSEHLWLGGCPTHSPTHSLKAQSEECLSPHPTPVGGVFILPAAASWWQRRHQPPSTAQHHLQLPILVMGICSTPLTPPPRAAELRKSVIQMGRLPSATPEFTSLINVPADSTPITMLIRWTNT